MYRRRVVLYSLAAALAFLALVVVGYLWVRSPALATLMSFTGQPSRDRQGAVGAWFSAHEGDDFVEGEGARTPSQSVAQFRLGRSARLTLKPESQVRFRRRGQGRGAVGLTVEVGEVDVRTSEGTLTLGSEFGELLIEPKSTVTLKRVGKRMVFGVEVGRVRLTSQAGQRSVHSGQSLSVDVGGIVVDEAGPARAKPRAEEKPEAPSGPVALNPADGVASADLVLSAGESCVVHDPSPPTRVGVRWGSVCRGPARLTIGRLRTESEQQGNLALGVGRHHYEVRCLDRPDVVAKQGDVRILRDSGTRQLPTFTPAAQVAADGRRYTVLYQERLPSVTVSWPAAPSAASYAIQIDGRTVHTRAPSHTFASGTLTPGVHTLVFSAGVVPPRVSRTTTIAIQYDAQAPAARVAEPASGFESGAEVAVAGQALPGWQVSAAGTPLSLDGARRFSAKVPAQGTLVIAFSHPTHGMHYYLRRPKRAAP